MWSLEAPKGVGMLQAKCLSNGQTVSETPSHHKLFFSLYTHTAESQMRLNTGDTLNRTLLLMFTWVIFSRHNQGRQPDVISVSHGGCTTPKVLPLHFLPAPRQGVFCRNANEPAHLGLRKRGGITKCAMGEIILFH